MIEVEGVTRSYGDTVAVDDLSFVVRPGEVVGLLGPNGAGKTTTLRMIATLLKPDRGVIRVQGHDVVHEPLAVRAALGYQTGDTGLYGRLTPREFLRYFGRLHRMPKAELEDRIDTLVHDFDIGEFADRPCSGLSTGQKQRVTLARTVLHDPPVLVLDEPTSGLDLVSAAFILQTIRRFAASGRAVLFSTHIMSEVELLCDRVVLIDRGVARARGTVDDLLRQSGEPQLSRAFLALVGRPLEAA